VSEVLWALGILAGPLAILGLAALAHGARQEDSTLPPPVSDSRSSIEAFRRINGNA
jgi:hypothetical protein